MRNPSLSADVFERYLSQHLDALYDMALRLTRNPVDAEDLVQDTSVRAFRFLHQFEPGSNFRAWIFRILMNTFINGYRRQKRRPARVVLDEVEFKLRDEDAERAMEKRPSRWERRTSTVQPADYFDDEITWALDQIPDDYRAVVLLCDVQGFSYKEIAAILNRPIGTVMSRLHRGRNILKSLLYEYAARNGYLKNSGTEDATYIAEEVEEEMA